MNGMRIEIWSDIACPWCYIGKRRLDTALDAFAHRAEVEVVWRSFELDRNAPRVLPPEPSYAERLARKYGTTREGAERMMRRIVDVAAEDGLDFRFDRIRPGNTFDAHRLLHLARARGLQHELEERLFAAYLCEGEAIGDRATLARQAARVGLDEAEATDVLESDLYADAVRADERAALEAAVHGVPHYVIDGRLPISGAPQRDVLLPLLERVWRETRHAAAPLVEGAMCGPEGCE